MNQNYFNEEMDNELFNTLVEDQENEENVELEDIQDGDIEFSDEEIAEMTDSFIKIVLKK